MVVGFEKAAGINQTVPQDLQEISKVRLVCCLVAEIIILCVRVCCSLRLTFDGHAPWTTDVHTYALDDFYEVCCCVSLCKPTFTFNHTYTHTCRSKVVLNCAS